MSHPAGGSSIASGSTTGVEWGIPSGVHAQTVALLWSGDNGAHWDLVGADLPNTGSYAWQVPETITTQARVAVILVESSDGGYIVEGVLGVSETFTIQAATTGVPGGTSVELALRVVSPNASSRGLEVTFGLPVGLPASLSLYDVAGRRVETREVGGLGAGVHTLRLGGATLPSGVYVVQLVQGGHRLTTRASLIH